MHPALHSTCLQPAHFLSCRNCCPQPLHRLEGSLILGNILRWAGRQACPAWAARVAVNVAFCRPKALIPSFADAVQQPLLCQLKRLLGATEQSVHLIWRPAIVHCQAAGKADLGKESNGVCCSNNGAACVGQCSWPGAMWTARQGSANDSTCKREQRCTLLTVLTLS